MVDLRTEPCFLHEITNCSTCTGLDKKLAAEESFPTFDVGGWNGVVQAMRGRAPNTFPARYAGKCAGCGERFNAGAPIRADSSGGWLAGCCS